jgi:PleD family two-component response regulator
MDDGNTARRLHSAAADVNATRAMTDILFADDDPAMREMVRTVLDSAGHGIRLVPDGSAALEAVREAQPDLIILDYRMGRPDGIETCRLLRANPRLEHIPVLILTAEGSVDDRVRGFDAGADDYLAKPFDARELLARVRALLSITRRGLDRNPTSGLPGGEAIKREYDRRGEVGAPFALCYFDLDQFKPFGDRFGFSLGDSVIRDAGESLVTAAADADFVGHIGGDDFLMICEASDARRSVAAAQAGFRERLKARVSRSVWRDGHFAGTDREGIEREIPLTRLSAAIVYLDRGSFTSLGELSERIAGVKWEAKNESSGIAEADLRAA